MAESAYAADLKSAFRKRDYGFESHLAYSTFYEGQPRLSKKTKTVLSKTRSKAVGKKTNKAAKKKSAKKKKNAKAPTKKSTPVKKETWFVYVLECVDLTLYVGIAKNVQKRFAMHSTGKGAKYTRAHKPRLVVYTEKLNNIGDAMRREREIKKWSRPQKVKTLNLPCREQIRPKRRRRKKAA